MTQTTEPAGPSPVADGAPSWHQYGYGYAYAGPAGLVAVPADAIRPDDRFSRLMTRLWARSPRWSAPLAVLFCFFGGVAYTIATHPTSSDAASVPNCIIKLTTGFDCPGCGGTRAFYYLLHGNVIAAARSHLILVFAAPYLAYMYIAWAANTAFRWRLPALRPSPKAISAFLIVWLVFSVLRNLPWAPFTWFYV
ncbi:MAG TPA: DUF2752 domain-containing protein [Micromonosporaceae bacterium]|jgi:hypothetical protein